MHQHASFIPLESDLRIDVVETIKPSPMEWYGVPLESSQVYAKGNMEKNLENIPINISKTIDVNKNVFNGAYFSPDEIETYTPHFKEYRDVFS